MICGFRESWVGEERKKKREIGRMQSREREMKRDGMLQDERVAEFFNGIIFFDKVLLLLVEICQ